MIKYMPTMIQGTTKCTSFYDYDEVNTINTRTTK